MSLELTVNKLINSSKEKFGVRWLPEVVDHITKREVNHKLKPFGFRILGFGASRVAFSYKDVAIKFDSGRKYKQNKEELRNYKKLIRDIPEAKYFLAPLLYEMKIDKQLVLVFPIVDIKEHSIKGKARPFTKSMFEVIECFTHDSHNENVGYYCGGLVCSDLDHFSSHMYGTVKLRIKEIKTLHKKKWKTYTKNFDKNHKLLMKSVNK